jgi:2-polyprenyl-3-methyl-5-hydroxy-6-metoxy-1,4-benzoquinol methylase
MPAREQRITEIHHGKFRDGESVNDAKIQLQGEEVGSKRLQDCVELTKRFAPKGKWLDIGCGTGTLIRMAKKSGIEAEGIELTNDRLTLARQTTQAQIYDKPLEDLDLPSESFAAVILTNVFSHLTSPTQTLACIRRILSPDGVAVLHTSEVGPGALPHHQFNWNLGDHLYFLGEQTMEHYAMKLEYDLIHRERHWQPMLTFSRERFKIKGRSRLRNFLKAACLYTPGVFPVLRWYMTSHRHAGNPLYAAGLVLKKSVA